MEIILNRTLKDSFPKARVLRARELRVVLLLLFFWFVSAPSTIEPFKYNYCRNLKVVIFILKFIEEFHYGNPDTPAMKVKENRAMQK